jgi:uncharacterized protein YycO
MIRILCYRGTSLLSKAIRAFNWGDYSHVAALNTATGEIIEAWHPGGVRKVTLAKHGHTPGTVVDVYRVEADLDAAAFWQMLEGELGKGYDFKGILGFLARSRTQSDQAWFCSELVFSVAAHHGALLLNCPAFKVSPTLLSYSPLLVREKEIVL